MKRRLKSPFLLSASLLLSLLAAPCHAYITQPFDAQGLLNTADVVCYAKVVAVAVAPRAIPADTHFEPPLNTEGSVATVEVISTIKGKAPKRLEVVFRKPTNLVNYTGLTPGEQTILFLKADQKEFRFVDDHNGKLEVPPHQPLTYTSTSPTMRLISELGAAIQHDTGAARLRCVEQLATFDSPVVAAYLRQLPNSPDMALQGTAYAALIRVGELPNAAKLTEFFGRQNDTNSEERFKTTGYSTAQLKTRILVAMESQLNRINGDTETQKPDAAALKTAANQRAQLWKGFDLIPFLQVSLDNSLAPDPRESTDMISQRSIADILANQIDTEGHPAYLGHTFRKGSRPLAVRLLASENLEVSASAARAIDRMIVEEHPFSLTYSPDLHKNYVTAVRQWLRDHPNWVNAG